MSSNIGGQIHVAQQAAAYNQGHPGSTANPWANISPEAARYLQAMAHAHIQNIVSQLPKANPFAGLSAAGANYLRSLAAHHDALAARAQQGTYGTAPIHRPQDFGPGSGNPLPMPTVQVDPNLDYGMPFLGNASPLNQLGAANNFGPNGVHMPTNAPKVA